VPVRPPFSFALACSYLQRSPGTVLEKVGRGEYRRVVVLESNPALLRVSALPRSHPAIPDHGAFSESLQVSLQGEHLGPEQADAAALLVARIFQSDASVAGLERAGAEDPIFAALLDEWRGLRPILLPTPFEALVWAILGQQVNVSFAAKTKRALAQRYGVRARFNGESYLLFPDPEALASARDGDLAALQLSRQKIRYVKGLAMEVASGRLDLDALGTAGPEEALTALQSLVGIGLWTAEYVLLRGYGHRDVIPAADGGLRNIIGKSYGLGRSATEAEVRELAQRWEGWRGYAAFYWWAKLQWSRHRAP